MKSMKLLPSLFLGATLLAGCRQAPVPTPADKPIAKPQAAAAAPAKPAAPTVGSAVVDVITQRDKIEAGKRAKATLEAAASRENKDIEDALKQ
jgi:hypothetical protein